MDFFSTREIASGLWIIIIFCFLLLYKPTRKSLIKLFKAFFVKTILLSCLLVVVYSGIFILILSYYELWKFSLLKTTLFWLIFVAFPTLFKVVRVSDKEGYFKKAISEDFKWTVIFSFVLGLYTFSLWFEILFIPVAIFSGMLLGASEKDKKNEKVTVFLKRLVAYSSILMFAFIIYQLIRNYKTYLVLATLNDFLFPIVFSLIFIPFLYLYSLYLNYSTTFQVLRNFINSPELYNFAKRKALLNFNYDVSGLKRWKQVIILGNVKTETDIVEAIKKIKELQIIEKNLPSINIEQGWSPYTAKDFLNDAELKTGYYFDSGGEDWCAFSNYTELDKEILSNNIAYYVNGNKRVVTSIKLVLNLYSPQSALDAHLVLLENAKTLYFKALHTELPKNIETAILFGKELDYDETLAEIKISKDEWGNSTKGYSLKFEIMHKSIMSFA
jgi:hypothetical protein